MHCKSLWIKASAKCIDVNVCDGEKFTKSHNRQVVYENINCEAFVSNFRTVLVWRNGNEMFRFSGRDFPRWFLENSIFHD